MAPFIPEEVDVFTIPHSRMKGLVNEYVEKLQTTNFSNVADLKILLDSLRETFKEFKLHEQIENTLIMKRLKSKLKQLSIRNTMVCNCHKDSHLTDMITLVQEGFAKKTEQDRLNYSRQLKKALEEFTEDFLPHMRQEEEVFQPMLLEYFTYDELCELKQKVIEWHLMKKDSQVVEKGLIEVAEKEELSDSCSEFEEDIATKREKKEESETEVSKTNILDLPQEITSQIFSYLEPNELTACRQVCTQWHAAVQVPELWREIHPRKWACGAWGVRLRDLDEAEEEEEEEDGGDEDEDRYQMIDDDADIDESADSEGDPNQTEQSKLLHREARILVGLVKYVLPSVGDGVRTLNLANCQALTNTMMQRLLKLTPNIEYLNLSNTRISDSGLKLLGKNWCGANLRYLNLSGCRVTDKTMQRLRAALVYNDAENPDLQKTPSNECLCEKKKRENLKKSEEILNNGMDYNESVEMKITRAGDEDKDVDDTSHPGIIHHIQPHPYYTSIHQMDSLLLHPQPGDDDYTEPAYNSLDIPLSVDVPLSNPCHSHCTDHANRGEPKPIEDCAGPKKQFPDHYHQNKSKPPLTNPFSHGVSSPDTRDKNKNDKTKYEYLKSEDVEEDEFEMKILKPPRMLSYLNLSGCYQITDEGLRSLAKAGPLSSLTYLDLSGCLLLTGQGLYDLTDQCPNLVHQTFYYCDNILDGPYSATASGCQNLQCSRRVCCRKGE